MQSEKHPWIYDVLLIVVLAAAAFLRFSGADWGELQHQHPDELFLTSVVANLRAHVCMDPLIPVDACPPEQRHWMGPGDYFNTATSTLNPYNRGYSFFVYGTLPLFVVRYAAEILGQTDYSALKLLGRQFSALADLGTIFLLYLIVAKLYNRRTALLAAAFSAFAVMQIQQSHFFTTDLFVNLFAFLAIYFAVGIITRESGGENRELEVGSRETVSSKADGTSGTDPNSRISAIFFHFARDPFFWLSLAFGISFGLAMASKVNIFPLALLLPGAFAVRLRQNNKERERFLNTDHWKRIAVYLVAGGLVAFLAFRIFQPYAFHGLLPDQHWLENISEQRVQARGDADLPWNLQWARRTHLYSFDNLTVWGLGLPLGILSWAGFLLMGWRIVKGEWRHVLLWSWTAAYFLWQSLQFNPTMRYQLPIYPLLAMIAAWGVFAFSRSPIGLLSDSNSRTPKRLNWKMVAATLIGMLVLVITAAWAYAFHTIYVREEPRMAASRWIYQNVPGPINVRMQTPDGKIYHQPLAFFDGSLIQAGAPYEATFNPQRDGLVTDVVLGHVVNPASPPGSSPGSQSLTLTISNALSPDSDQVLARASLTQNFSSGKDSRGDSASLILDHPLPVSAGQIYYLRFETDDGLLTFSGASVANETDYDYGLPFRIDGFDGFGGIYRGDLNFQVYWDDNADKLARFTDTLNQADYIFIPTNHQYAQITRLPERYPLTTEYYRQLLGCPAEQNIIECYRQAKPGKYTGNLGFDLVAVFESYPTIGPIVINDQAAEEAFTFYDHPKVFVFKKRADYNATQVASILGAVDLTNVVHLAPRQAASYKNLMLPPDHLAQQRAGGTWSDLFNYDWLQNKYPVVGLVIWYLFVFLLGLLTYPIVRTVLPGLADKGYPLARTLGLVILAYIPWLLGSLGVAYSRITIALVFAGLALAGLSLGWMRRDELLEEWHTKRRYFLMVEGLFLSFFIFDLLIRLGNPDLWHPSKGGERPMDFSYFNAVLKSTTFPPYDPWFAGGYINYYYYGFVLVGTPVKLLGIVPSIAYNFILPTLFAMVAMSAFSIGFNLVEKTQNGDAESSNRSLLTTFLTPAVVAGLASALLMVVLGNLGTIQMVFQALARIAAPGGVITDADFFQRLMYAAQGFYKTVFAGATLPIGRGEWYWNPSRVIPPGPGNEITEFPFFTFLYSDLHAHMIVMPLTLFVIAWALGTVRARRTSPVSIIFGALVLGAVRPVNTWDVYTYIPLAALALGYTLWRYADLSTSKLRAPLWMQRAALTLSAILALVFLQALFYKPFTNWFSQAYGAVDPWTASYTPLTSYLTHWSLFLFLIAFWLAWETRNWMASTPVSSLEKLRPFQLLIEFALAGFLVALLYFAYRQAWIGWLALPLAAWAGTLLLRPDQPDTKRSALFMVGTALVVTLVVEFISLRGDIGRMNTLFKLYLQAWTLFAVSGGAALVWVLVDVHTWRPRWRNLWQGGVIVLFSGAMLFTVSATSDKVTDRMTPDTPHSLDAMTYMETSQFWDTTIMDLSQDYHAIRWMQDNVQGSPVIVEANCPEYRWCSRFTIYTGLPGVIGWNWHQRQQRALVPPNLITDRIAEIANFYTTTDPKLARAFLTKYDVRYIVVGQLEQVYYPGDGLSKFEQYNGTCWKEAYRDRQTAIYKVLP